MPFVAPFKGLRYDTGKVGNLSRVVTPPYDVISPRAQAQYYTRHRWNFVRVVFGRNLPSDTAARNRYSRARQTLTQWIQEGILKFDPQPSFYPYLQEYTLHRRRYRRWGIIALVRLDSPRIYPHERTKKEPKQDRLLLLKTVGASLSPIFGLIPDAAGRYRRLIEQACRSRRPEARASLDGVRHSLWRVSEAGFLRRLQEFLAARELVIADGHHRYEAAVAYRDRRKREDRRYTPHAPYNFAMFYLAAAGSAEPGLLPTHRVIQKIQEQRFQKFLKKKQARGMLEPVRGIKVLEKKVQDLEKTKRIGIGFTSGNGSEYLIQESPASGYELDVEWLHREIIPRWIGSRAQIQYTQDIEEGIRQIRRGRAQGLFVMQPPRLSDVFAWARAGRRMPGKTTYFYPKPVAGLVEYKF